MAYNSGFNPDALPAFAEPEQAAQLFSRPDQQRLHSGSLSANTNANANPNPNSNSSFAPQSQTSYHNKPPPPIPQQTPQYNQQPLAASQQNPQYHQQQPASVPQQNPPYYHHQPPPVPQQNPQYHQQHSQRLQSPSNPAGINSAYGTPGPVSSLPQQHYGHHGSPAPGQGPFPPAARPGPATTSTSTPRPLADTTLFALFKAVDRKGTGQLTEEELRTALVNGDFTQFDPHTVKMMIRMFDSDRSGSIGFDEFCGLWSFLASWRQLFDHFDEDNSGSISYEEYSKALLAFGYHLSASFTTLLYRHFDKRGKNHMSFDLFIQSCISLKRMTDVFKKYDDDRDGYITLGFEEFLTEILRQR